MTAELLQYFSQFANQPEPALGCAPAAVNRFKAGALEVTGSRLILSDSRCAPMDGVPVQVPAGQYELLLECYSYGSDGRIARLIVQLPGANPVRGNLLGRFAVNAASACVCDGDVLKGFAVANEGAHQAWLAAFNQQRLDSPTAGYFGFPEAATTVFYVRTGFGEGLYPVYSLLENDRVVGAEAVFLAPGQGYREPVVDSVEDEEMVVLHLDY